MYLSAAAGLLAGLLLAVPFLLMLRRRAAAERAARLEREQLAERRRRAVLHLARDVLGALKDLAQGRQPATGVVPRPLGNGADVGEEFARAVHEIHAALTSAEGARQERALRDSVLAAYESVARTMHAMATVQQGVLDGIGRGTEDPALMGQVMKADHAAAQMIHKAQTLLVMSGIWPARRETRAVTLYDCVRGAMSRVLEYGRIEVHGGQTVHVSAPGVEGITHVLAELCQNATSFSPPSSPVVVTFREVGAGAVVEIDDGGLGMAPDIMDRAVAGLRDETDVTQLGAMPRLGLACVGRWARELGLTVDLSGASAYGGVRATVFVPHRLLTHGPQSAPAGSAAPTPSEAARELGAGQVPAAGLPYGERQSAAYAGPQPAALGGSVPRQPSAGSTRPAPVQAPAPAPAPAPAQAPAPEPAPAEEAVTAKGLPQRRNRRDRKRPGSSAVPPQPAATEAYPAERSPLGTGTQRPPSYEAQADAWLSYAPEFYAPPADWTPQAAGASVAGVVAGSRKGREESGEYKLPSADQLPPETSRTPSHPEDEVQEQAPTGGRYHPAASPPPESGGPGVEPSPRAPAPQAPAPAAPAQETTPESSPRTPDRAIPAQVAPAPETPEPGAAYPAPGTAPGAQPGTPHSYPQEARGE